MLYQLSYTVISLAALQAAHTVCGTKTIVIREMVDRTGIEPATSSVQTRRSPY